VAYWVKINYERKDYFVDLDRISVFTCTPNGRLTFWLPASSIPVILNRQSSPEDYYKILDYIEQLPARSRMGSWIQLFYDRQEYIIDLDTISSFCYANNKLTFWLPDSSLPIVLSQETEPDAYNRVMDFLIKKTGKSIN
jgi:hypothetical protein